MANAKAVAKKAPTKTEVYTAISEETNVSKKEVAAVLESLGNQVKKALGAKGPGVFSIPGLVKVSKKKIPAKPANPNYVDPFTKQIKPQPAKPARTKVVVRALKGLKDMVQ